MVKARTRHSVSPCPEVTGTVYSEPMRASEIRHRFLAYFERNEHAIRPSSPLVPADDPTLLFTNAGMVQFKHSSSARSARVSACARPPRRSACARAASTTISSRWGTRRATTRSSRCSATSRLATISSATRFASRGSSSRSSWEFQRSSCASRVIETDDEARALWKEICGIPDSRIYGLGEQDNFWQMADTGPCGPCTEIYVDLAHVADDWAFPEGATGEWTDTKRTEFSRDAFVEGAEAGRFLEIWNLVFMQFDRQPDGVLKPLPKPSVDTGAGLERIAAVMQGVTNNYHTDLFVPLIAKAEEVLGMSYDDRPGANIGARCGPRCRPRATGRSPYDAVSFRVLADHARAVAFLLADGVFPSNEGRGYVLRRILRRAVRHAWLLGRREPTLVKLVSVVIEQMQDVYPELAQRRTLIVDTTRAEEERFLATIEGGCCASISSRRCNSTQGSTAIRGTISGDDAFRLYDTFGFPIDLTELMAHERGYTVDIAGFEAALQATARAVAGRAQRARPRRRRRRARRTSRSGRSSRARRRSRRTSSATMSTDASTEVVAIRRLPDSRLAILLQETPFYAESGGQISDVGEIVGDGWRVDVDDVKKVDGRHVRDRQAHGRVPLRARAGARAGGSPSRHGAQSHGDASAARGAAPGARRARAPGGLARRAGSPAFRLSSSRSDQARAAVGDRGDRESRDLGECECRHGRAAVSRCGARRARWRCSARSTATSCAS